MDGEEFSDKIAIVTGAATGIGRGVARALAWRGARVVAGDIDGQGVRDLAAELGREGLVCLPIEVDLTKPADANGLAVQTREFLGEPQILVTAAGGFPARVAAEEITDEQWEHGLRLNLSSAFYCCRAVIPDLKSAGWGRIVTVSSAAGRSPSNPTTAFYAAAKAGLIGLTRHLAQELGPFGITVNTVAPGTTMTPRVRTLYTEEHFARLRSVTPVGRIAEVEDQVVPILFLLSEGARHVTGATLDVNGGRLML